MILTGYTGQSNEKGIISDPFFIVAGAGFEPAAFGL
jgi:hypothetical protein